MITIKHKGKTAKIRNDDWRAIRRRFDPANKQPEKHPCGEIGAFRIDESCPLCERYTVACVVTDTTARKCRACPLFRWGTEDQQGCFVLLLSVLGVREIDLYFDFDRLGHVWWEADDDDLAVSQLKKLQAAMDRIEAEQ